MFRSCCLSWAKEDGVMGRPAKIVTLTPPARSALESVRWPAPQKKKGSPWGLPFVIGRLRRTYFSAQIIAPRAA
jgi:hypothetical protein